MNETTPTPAEEVNNAIGQQIDRIVSDLCSMRRRIRDFEQGITYYGRANSCQKTALSHAQNKLTEAVVWLLAAQIEK